MSDQTLYRLTVTPSNPSYDDAAVSAWELIADGVLVSVEPNLDGMRRAWHTLTPCICGSEYTDRGLESPRCGNHVVDEELLDLWRGALEDDDE